MKMWLKNNQPGEFSELETLLMLALTENGEKIYVNLSPQEHKCRHFRTLLKQEIHESGEEGKRIFQSLLFKPFSLACHEDKAIKKALVLRDWIDGVDTLEVERKYDIHGGAISRLGEGFSRLVESLAVLAEIEGRPAFEVRRIRELSQRLLYGVSVKGLALSQINVKGLERTYINVLVQNGYYSMESLTRLSVIELEKFLPAWLAQRLAKELKERCLFPKEIDHEPEKESAFETIISKEPSGAYKAYSYGKILRIDRRHPGIIYLKGQRVILTSKQFNQLVVLSSYPGACVSYNELYGTVWKDDVAVEKQQINYHKNRLIERFSRVIPKKETKALITTISGEGLVLNLRPGEVELF